MEHDTAENPNMILGAILKEILIPECIVVETEVDAGSGHIPSYREDDDGFQFEETVEIKPPPISILIRSLEKDDWRPEQKQLLPDGIRDFHKTNITLDFKHDKPISKSTLAGAIGTSYFFCKNYGYDCDDVLDCIVTPYDIPELFVFQTTIKGVYKSDNPLLEQIRLIALNQLPNTPWNASLKYFSADPQERELAISNLRAMGLNAYPLSS